MLRKLKLKLNAQGNPLLSQRLDNIGLTLIGLVSLGYCCFADRFAELSIQLPFFDFPIFIGEIFLFFCLLLLFFNWKIKRQKITGLVFVVFMYVAFILYKAFVGYFEWGPLALRHAAMFYYLLFAVLGYSFFRKSYFTGRKASILIILLMCALIGDKKFLHIIEFGRITCFILSFILIKQLPIKGIRYFLFLVLFLFAPYQLFFLGSRAMLLSNLACVIFLVIVLSLVTKIKKNIVIGFTIFVFAFLYLGVIKFSDKNALRSILSLEDNINVYKRCMADIVRLEPSFIMQPIKKLHVYNKAKTVAYEFQNESLPDKTSQFQLEQHLFELRQQQAEIDRKLAERTGRLNKLNNAVLFEEKVVPRQISLPVEEAAKPVKLTEKSKVQLQPVKAVSRQTRSSPEVKAVSPPIVPSKGSASECANSALVASELEKNTTDLLIHKQKLMHQQSVLEQQLGQLTKTDSLSQYRPRDLAAAYGNSIFRILVWQDIITELAVKKPIFGFDFGKPFRSKKIEILNIADGEWKRDGWIATHNSYLEIIYRAGIIGVLLILLILIVFLKMVSISIINRSISGILLCGTLLCFLVAANFMLIMELPYYAIPLWSLFGLTLAYLRK